MTQVENFPRHIWKFRVQSTLNFVVCLDTQKELKSFCVPCEAQKCYGTLGRKSLKQGPEKIVFSDLSCRFDEVNVKVLSFFITNYKYFHSIDARKALLHSFLYVSLISELFVFSLDRCGSSLF